MEKFGQTSYVVTEIVKFNFRDRSKQRFYCRPCFPVG